MLLLQIHRRKGNQTRCLQTMEKGEQTMTDKKYPCKKCKIKKAYAKMDFHWLDHEDCPYVCPFVKNQDKEGGR